MIGRFAIGQRIQQQPKKPEQKPAGQTVKRDTLYGASAETVTPTKPPVKPAGPATAEFSLNGGEGDSFQAAPKAPTTLNPPKPPPSPADAKNIAALVQTNKNPEITKILNDFAGADARVDKGLPDATKKDFLDRLTTAAKPEDFGVLMRAKQLIMGE